jgi:hypothetical protein
MFIVLVGIISAAFGSELYIHLQTKNSLRTLASPEFFPAWREQPVFRGGEALKFAYKRTFKPFKTIFTKLKTFHYYIDLIYFLLLHFFKELGGGGSDA